jgi:hypothetical protein
MRKTYDELDPANAQSQARGKRKELRFFLAFTKYEKFTRLDAPPWYKGIRKASRFEDQRGSDFFIVTTIGLIPINVKSSPGRVETWLSKFLGTPRTHKKVVVPVGGYLDHSQCIRMRTFEAIEQEYSSELQMAV